MIKYILTASVLLNSILVMVVLGVLPFLLYTSIIINCVLMWYTKKVVDVSDSLKDDVVDIYNEIESYSDHLDQIHELETFYGDQDLQNLIKHTRTVVNNIIDIQQKYYDDVEVIEDEDYEEGNEKEDETPQDVE